MLAPAHVPPEVLRAVLQAVLLSGSLTHLVPHDIANASCHRAAVYPQHLAPEAPGGK
jgi:hypothetical protein